MPRCVMVLSIRRSFAFAFALLTLAATEAAAQRGAVSGLVTARDGGESVEGATVTVHAPTGGAIGQATTDEQGRYRIGVSPGTYSVVVRHVAFSPQTVPAVTVASGATVETNVALEEKARLLQRVDVISGPTARAPGEALGTLGNANPVALETRVAPTPLHYIDGEVGFDF